MLLLSLKLPQKLLIILRIKSKGQLMTYKALPNTVSYSLLHRRLLPLSLHPRCSRPTGFLAVPSGSLLPMHLVFFPRASRPPRIHSGLPRCHLPKDDHLLWPLVSSYTSSLPTAFFLCLTHCCFLCNAYRHMSAVIFLFIDCLPLLECRFRERWGPVHCHFPWPSTVAQRTRWVSVEEGVRIKWCPVVEDAWRVGVGGGAALASAWEASEKGHVSGAWTRAVTHFRVASLLFTLLCVWKIVHVHV